MGSHRWKAVSCRQTLTAKTELDWVDVQADLRTYCTHMVFYKFCFALSLSLKYYTQSFISFWYSIH